MTTDARTGHAEPSEPALLSMFDDLCNWGRWGDDDQLGTLNYIDGNVTRNAAGLIRNGRTVSLARTIIPTYSPDNPKPPLHFMMASGEGAPSKGEGFATDWYGIACHGYATTHLDSLGHLFWNGVMYNGYPSSSVDQLSGAKEGSVEAAGSGVVTRGVLLDIPMALGVEWLPSNYHITPRDFEAAEARSGVAVQTGDALLVRTGRDVNRKQRGLVFPDPDGAAGLSASCMPWMHEREVALLGSDSSHEVVPPSYTLTQSPVHMVGGVAMGLWLLDNANLEELAAAAAEEARWDFLFTLAPLKLRWGTGSAVNPLAVF